MRQSGWQPSSAVNLVSIHAPVKGATRPWRQKASFWLRFNSRTRKGCDETISNIADSAKGFNSRTRKGCDAVSKMWRGNVDVSIHAPVKGATSAIFRHNRHRGFNSRTRKGCDAFAWIYPSTLLGFNSRTRKGCDVASGRGERVTLSFNSRTRKGCDISSCTELKYQRVSIHAPVKGATTFF